MNEPKRYDLDGNADGYFDDPFMKVREKGKFVLHTDYAALLARHNALVEAVAWERECRAANTSRGVLNARPWGIGEFVITESAARAEVDRLIGGKP